jgi:hypothetical protein
MVTYKSLGKCSNGYAYHFTQDFSLYYPHSLLLHYHRHSLHHSHHAHHERAWSEETSRKGDWFMQLFVYQSLCSITLVIYPWSEETSRKGLVRLLLWFINRHVILFVMWSCLFPDLFHDLFPDLCDRCNLYIIVRLIRLVLWSMNRLCDQCDLYIMFDYLISLVIYESPSCLFPDLCQSQYCWHRRLKLGNQRCYGMIGRKTRRIYNGGSNEWRLQTFYHGRTTKIGIGYCP